MTLLIRRTASVEGLQEFRCKFRVKNPFGPRAPDRTAVLLIAHGSRQQAANDDLHELTARIAAAGTHPIVEGCFLELAEPDLPTGGARCVARGATRVLMVPYFLSAGVHLQRDLTSRATSSAAATRTSSSAWARRSGHIGCSMSLVAARIQELDKGEPMVGRGSTAE